MPMSNDVRFNENAVCDACGRFGAHEFGDERLCAECYEKRGSCCPEFGADDLWRHRESPPERKPPDSTDRQP